MTAPVQTSSPAAARLSATELAAYLALVQAQAGARRQVTRAAVAAVLAPLASFTAWWDSDSISRLTKQILRQVQPAQIRAARLTDAYIARVLSKQRGRVVRPVGAVDVTRLRRKLPDNVLQELATGRRIPDVVDIGDTQDGPNGDIDRQVESLLKDGEKPLVADPADAYGRLADTYRWQRIAHNATHEDALAKVLARAESVVETDIALAIRDQETETMRRTGVKLYRRILHPELAETGLSCGLCIVAADRIYTVEKFKRDLHLNCHCESTPIDSGKDPAVQLNADDLESLYRAAGQAVGKEGESVTGGGKKQLGALKRVRVGVTEHGELGPILINRSGKFRDAADFAKTQVASPKIRAEAQLPAMEESLARWEAKAAAGEPGTTSPIAFHRKRIAELRRAAGV